MDNIIKCRFTRDSEPYGREYSYLTKEAVEIGDMVQAETQHGLADLVVRGLKVPEAEVENFKDKLKYIIGKKPKVKASCETCLNCIACGEGDHICSIGDGNVVIMDYATADDYMWCGGKMYTE